MLGNSCLFTDAVGSASVIDGVGHGKRSLCYRTKPDFMRSFTLTQKVTAFLFQVGSESVVIARAHLSKMSDVVKTVEFGLTRLKLIVKLNKFFSHDAYFSDEFFYGRHFCNKTGDVRTFAPVHGLFFSFVNYHSESKSATKLVGKFPERKTDTVVHD